MNARRRIAMVAACPFPSPQGSQVFIREMCQQLSERGHEVHLLTYGEGDGTPAKGFVHHRIRRLPGDAAMRSGPTPVKPVLDVLLAYALDRLLGSGRFDIVHCHNYEATAVALAVRTRRRTPVVYHSHNLMGDELPSYFETAASRKCAAAFGRFLDREIPRRADHAIALCDPTAETLRANGVVGERLSVIPPAVGDVVARSATPALDDLPSSAFKVGYCGNLDRYQNLTLLAEACAILASRFERDSELRLITHACNVREVEKLRAAAMPARVVVRECRDYGQACRETAGCDVLTLPRRSGSGFPIKLLNYMSHGRPIVSGECGAKALAHGESGLIVADGDRRAFAAALATVAGDPAGAARLGAAARAEFERKFTWSRVVAAIEDVYSHTLAWRLEAGRVAVLDGQG